MRATSTFADTMRAPLLNLLLTASLAGASLFAEENLAQAQTPAPQAAAVSPDAIKQREQELEAARARQKSAEEAQAKLKAEITALGQDRTQLNQQLIDTAANVRSVETKIDEIEARLRTLNGREQEMRGSLDSRRADIVEVLAALQRAGRRTPPALLVRPEDALQSLRTAMLLGADKRSAAEFSFFLAMPTMAGAFTLDLIKNHDQLTSGNVLLVAIGFACSFVSGYFVVKTFLTYVTRHGFTFFAWWRVILGALGLIALALGR